MELSSNPFWLRIYCETIVLTKTRHVIIWQVLPFGERVVQPFEMM